MAEEGFDIVVSRLPCALTPEDIGIDENSLVDVVDQDYGDEVDQRDGDRPPFAPTGGDTRPDFIPTGVTTD